MNNSLFLKFFKQNFPNFLYLVFYYQKSYYNLNQLTFDADRINLPTGVSFRSLL